MEQSEYVQYWNQGKLEIDVDPGRVIANFVEDE